MRKLKAGFTLIELLVVIAILGILAIGLVVALDPIEHINKATDTTTLALARQLASSADQFQTSNSFSPACPDQTCTAYDDSLNTTSTVSFTAISTVNARLAAAGTAETNDVFIHHPQAINIYVSLTNTTPPSDTKFVMCWQPASKSEKQRADINNSSTTIYNSQGAILPASSCPADNTNTCYRCVKQ